MKENEIERKLIDILTHEQNQWTYRNDLKTEEDLWNNVRNHINRINKRVLADIELTDSEFDSFKVEFFRLTETPFKASQWLRGENGIASIMIEREDTSKGRITLDVFSNKDICGGISSYEIVNQIRPNTERQMRGDVTFLINGLPVIHLELKTDYSKDGYFQAFDQIKRYATSGYFDGIYATTQIFVISNNAETKYFARPSSNDEKAFDRAIEFLFTWRTPNNENVNSLFDFAKKVLTIPMAHELVSRYSVLVDDKKNQKYLMVLRPYQIHAIKKIREQAARHEGGFIWHATGSGKTITSFVATKLLAKASPGVDRTVMVVDRTDLDAQTKDEFTKFASEYHTGQASGNKGNTLIVGIDNQRQLTNNLLSKTNNNTIIITTIQKISAAIRNARENDSKQFEKLRGEHIVFIVDECHRAVSDEQMKEIKKLLPNSTWIGLTGTPILDENKKQENGTYARTTHDQYGPKLHAYTTKNAMDDQSVLGFHVEYFSTMKRDSEEMIHHQKLKEKNPNKDSEFLLKNMDDIEKEALIDNKYYEKDEHIEVMLENIFKRSNVVKKFQVKNGFPTMSAILTTHSIAQAKRIYKIIQEKKREGTLLNGRFTTEKDFLDDIDFPRIAITYSMVTDEQDKINVQQDEFKEVIKNYNEQFDTTYSVDDIDKYNRNVNKRLERKEAQYQQDGKWLDLVIVVDRLLTGFDSPTVQTLFVDRELKYQKLLQAFSRTNRTLKGKDKGVIVTFRKPMTMKKNVEESIKLFSDDDKNWESLVPKDYKKVREEFKEAYSTYQMAKEKLVENPNDLMIMVEKVKTYSTLNKVAKALSSYDDYNDTSNNQTPDYEYFADEIKQIDRDHGIIENLKKTIKDHIPEDTPSSLISDIEFTSERDALDKEEINSAYIRRLLGEAIDRKEGAREKFEEEIKDKSEAIKKVYEYILDNETDGGLVKETKQEYFATAIDQIIAETADKLQVPRELLKKSYQVYHKDDEIIPHMSEITEKMRDIWDKESFEAEFNENYRSMYTVISNYWKSIIEEKIMPFKGEL